MRDAIAPFQSFIATPCLSKHRLFVWIKSGTLPDHALIVFARDDDYTFGVLHSRAHEVWALKMGTQLESRPRYTPTTTFETFPFPRPSPSQRSAIGEAAKTLNDHRVAWLDPAEVSLTEVAVRSRTLTNLYNSTPTWLELDHKKLNEAVFQAYGWRSNITNEQILEELIALNGQREPA